MAWYSAQLAQLVHQKLRASRNRSLAWEGQVQAQAQARRGGAGRSTHPCPDPDPDPDPYAPRVAGQPAYNLCIENKEERI